MRTQPPTRAPLGSRLEFPAAPWTPAPGRPASSMFLTLDSSSSSPKHIPSQRCHVSVHPLVPQAQGRSCSSGQNPAPALREKRTQTVIKEIDINYNADGDERKYSRLQRQLQREALFYADVHRSRSRCAPPVSESGERRGDLTAGRIDV